MYTEDLQFVTETSPSTVPCFRVLSENGEELTKNFSEVSFRSFPSALLYGLVKDDCCHVNLKSCHHLDKVRGLVQLEKCLRSRNQAPFLMKSSWG